MKLRQLELPEGLKRRLARFRTVLFLLETGAAVTACVAGLLASVLLLGLSDRFWDTPPVLRAAMTAGGLFALAAACASWIRRWLVTGRSPRTLAEIIRHRYRGLGDQLHGIIDLADPDEDDNLGSEGLRHAAIEQVAERSAAYNLRYALDRRQTVRNGVLAGAAIALAGGFAAVDPNALGNALARWRAPWKDLPRYTFTQFGEMPERRIVPSGEAFHVAVEIDPSSRWMPGELRYQFADYPVETAAVKESTARIRVPGVQEAGPLIVRCGDARATIEIVPMYRPVLTELAVTQELPEYLGHAPAERTVSGAELAVLEGSRIAFRGAAVRPLERLTVTGDEAPDVRLTGTEFRADPITVTEEVDLRFDWVDHFGLAAHGPLELAVRTVADQLAAVDCPDIPSAVAIRREESLPVRVFATDDYGVRDVRVDIRVRKRRTGDETAPEAVPEERVVADDLLLAEGGPQQVETDVVHHVCPADMGVDRGTVLTLTANARDYQENVLASTSPEYRIYVLTDSEHMKLLEKQLARLMLDLEDVIRDEEGAEGELDRTLDSLDEAAPARSKREVARNAEREAANAQRLRDLSGRLQELIEEGLKNESVPQELLGDWSDQMNRMQGLSGKDMPTLANALARNSEKPSLSEQELEDLNRQRAEIIEKLRKLWEDMDESVKNVAMRNFANRLRAGAAAQRRIAHVLGDRFVETAGAPSDELSEDARKRLVELGDEEDMLREDARDLQDDLSGFYNRTRLGLYRELSDAMNEVDLFNRMHTAAAEIRANRVFGSISRCGELAAQFDAWADRLEKDGPSADSGKPAELSEPALEFVLNLLRILAGEQNLRDRTRGLHKRKDSDPDYVAKSAKLAVQQEDIRVYLNEASDILAEHPEIAGPHELRVHGFLDRIQLCMTEVALRLDGGDTGPKTVAAETEIIELIASTGRSCSGGGQCAATALAGLFPSMGMGAGGGAMGGGSSAGGDTRAANDEAAGADEGFETDSRSGKKTLERSLSDVPPEYRDLLESYFERLEEQR